LRTLFAAAAKLEKIVPDRIQRLRAAMAANDISLQLLASDIQSLKDKLAAESTRVSAQAASAKAESVDMAERAAEQMKREIEAKQQELQQKLIAIENARNRIAQKESAFTVAFTRRSAEIEQLSKEVSTL
jgi:hypothetical protein